MFYFWLIFIIVISVIVLWFLLCYGMFLIAFSPKRRIVESKLSFPKDKNGLTFVLDNEWLSKIKLELVKIHSYDLRTMYGYYAKLYDNHRYLICCHGWHGYYKETSLFAHSISDKLQFNVLFIMQRAHDKSKGLHHSFGWKEGKDLCAWINKIVKDDPKAEIVLYGDSMGATTVMNALGENVPDNVKCAIADCGFNSTYQQVLDVTKNMKYFIKGGFGIGIRLFSFLILHTDIKKDGPTKQLKKSHTPIMFVHGEKDRFVPYENMQKNYLAVQDGVYKEKHTFSCGHALSYFSDPKRYDELAEKFITRFIK